MIQDSPVYWAWYGSKEKWLCVALNKHINMKDYKSEEEGICVECWLETDSEEDVKVFKIEKEKKEEKTISQREWDPLDCLPPPVVPAPPVIPAPPVAPALLPPPVVPVPPALPVAPTHPALPAPSVVSTQP